MIKYFPRPYPDELLYSVIARFQRHFGNSQSELIRSLWGKTKYPFRGYQVNRLQKLLDNTLLGQCYSAKQLAFQHTLWPFFSAFSGRDVQNTMFHNMIVDVAKNTTGFIGSHLSNIGRKKSLQFCPECMKADIESYGEPYWHRIHQAPGVLICPWHEIVLRNTCPMCGIPILSQGMQYACLDACCVNGHDLSLSEPKVNNIAKKTLEHLISYAHEVYKLLLTDCCYEPQAISQRYIIKLRELGFVGLKGHLINPGNFTASFIEYFGNEFLNLLESHVDTNITSWLRIMIWRDGYKRLYHPLRHLLLIKYLFGSLESFNISDTEYLPFGKGPWPCLNPVASHYRMLVINDCYIYQGSFKKTHGIFTCECGYIYSRVGPDKTNDDRYRVGNVISYGSVWEDALNNLVNSGKFTMKEIELKMKVSRMTLIKYINKRKRE
ncbi:TnsD family Tn7-like transposition protein [Sporomusa acidovorans]|uniref:TnsD family Tn7-like transposition protein n=1 Tax=Sporomusa acidovorans TaxID=112900 RepID=UPI00087E6EA5|nr:TnsD family Tn7-like transposition protein [Sporomusa acidovorans]OZC19001.1 hypothetical protein SPACI_30870 [Sporomusa acidovorans DSM 3132]SDD72671.1 TniQ protein [Sporomusa acidovorans]